MDAVAGGDMEGWRDGGMVEEVGRRARLPSERTIGLTTGGWEEEEDEEEEEEEEDEDESAGFKERATKISTRTAPSGVCVSLSVWCVCVCYEV